MAGPQRVRHARHNNVGPHGPQPHAQQGPTDIFDDEDDPLPVIACQITHLYGMYWSPCAVLNAEAELRQAREDSSEEVLRAAASDDQKLNYELCDRLSQLQPELFEELAVQGAYYARNVHSKLEDGRNGAKAEDNQKVKNGIAIWCSDWVPSLLHEPKSSRGVAHPETARRLAPII
ncbi:hypothetical protein FRC06_008944, partial [Ceratobasidium sp. 370]